MQRFKSKLAAQGVNAFLVRSPLNTTYLTGYWHTTTERPEATFMNHDDADPWFMYPALDRDLVRSWWFGSGKTYFDFKDDGSFPNEGKVAQGKTVDLFRLSGRNQGARHPGKKDWDRWRVVSLRERQGPRDSA